jgi:plastocyanin domain-containing protein
MWRSTIMLGVLVTAASVTATACTKEGQATPERSPYAAGQGRQTGVIEMSVTAEGFVPAAVRVKAGQPVKLVVTRKVERTCATEIVIKDFGINKPLPLNQAVEVAFTPTAPGEVRYACAMDMIAGVIVVE